MSKFTITLQRCELFSWDTPLSDADWVGAATVKDEDSLWISLRAKQYGNDCLWVVQFTNVSDYKVTHGSTVSDREGVGWTACHRPEGDNTNVAEAERFLERLRSTVEDKETVAQAGCCDKLKHFRIFTEDETIDVFTTNEPQFRMIGSQAA